MSQIIASTYEIIEKLGAGGGGNVYLAWHLRLKKRVVLKIDKRKLSTSQEMLRREVDILKELSHPYIPQVYDFFVEDEEIYTVMDYIEGESLDKALKRGEHFSQAQVVRWACQLLDALCYLHNPTHGEPPKGYVHSDIKPANLMHTPQGDICLIDFNIALALGEENVIGCSAGYASPEHYGLDFSSKYDEENSIETGESIGAFAKNAGDADETLTIDLEGEGSEDECLTVTMASSALGSLGVSGTSSSLRKRVVIPDVRSDIYSVGATLYHLLNGKRPSRNATEVIPLSDREFSDQIVRIISKAMNPNPDLRYQTADEMRREFLNLRKNDPRMRRWHRQRRIASVLLPVLFLVGGSAVFVGLKGMQSMESWLKLTEYSQTALDKGDVEKAIDYSLQILSESSNSFIPEDVPGIQKVLTEAIGAYDLSDGYKMYRTIELPSSPHYLVIAPDGKSAAALCGQNVIVFDTVSAEVMAELPVEPSSISEIQYRDNNTILYAGESGMKAYNVMERRELWAGETATSICISGNGKIAAGIYEGETFATVYDTETGKIKGKIDFEGKSQSIGIKDNLFALNSDGSLLAVSFQDGSLELYDLDRMEDGKNIKESGLVIFSPDSGYKHFEGGFFGQYLAFSAYGSEQSTFAVVDAVKKEEKGGFQSETSFTVQADESGIYVGEDNIFVKIDPVTGEQVPQVTMDENILCFARDDAHTVATSENEIYFFNQEAQLLSRYNKEYTSDLVDIAAGTAVIGSMDRPVVRIMQYKENSDVEIFSYDFGYQHDETRVSADEKTVMLFSYDQFRIYEKEGILVKEMDIPDSDQVVDQQFIRDEEESYLEVIYGNGKVDAYSASDGNLLWEENAEGAERKAGKIEEEFIVDDFRIESPLHGTPIVYDIKTEKEIARLKKDTYLTYVTKAGDYIIAQYVEVGGECIGQLLNKEFEVLAELPYLRDVIGETLIFDYPTGSIRESPIYSLEELIDMVHE